MVKPLLLAALLLTAGSAWGQQSTTTGKGLGSSSTTTGKGLGGSSTTTGQTGGSSTTGNTGGSSAPKSKLEEMIAQALKNNPDIRVAEAKAHEAEAELNRARLLVTQKVVVLHSRLEVAQAGVQQAEASFRHAELRYKRMKDLQAQKAAGAEVVDEAEAALQSAKAALLSAKAELAKVEAELPYLLGKQPRTGDAHVDSAARYLAALALQQMVLQERHDTLRALEGLATLQNQKGGATADKLRKALDAPFSLRAEAVPLTEVLNLFRESKLGVLIQVKGPTNFTNKVSVSMKEVPFGAALQWLEDALPNHRIVVREYGLLIAPADQLPAGAVPLQMFWKKEDAPKKERPGTTGDSSKNAPKEQVEGEIRAVEKDLVKINLGSDAGLAKGHTLEVYRMKPQPKYLGTLRILEVSAKEAVGQPVGRLSDTPKAGDRVASRIVSEK
jgi:hypothetical protein